MTPTLLRPCCSGDTKLLATLTDGAEVLLWRWQQAKVVMTVSADSPAVAACLSLWDDGLLAVASHHIVKAHKVDVRTGSCKSTNAMMLVRGCRAQWDTSVCWLTVCAPLARKLWSVARFTASWGVVPPHGEACWFSSCGGAAHCAAGACRTPTSTHTSPACATWWEA